MLMHRVMPCLLLRNRALVKTVRFKDASYVGDPINTIRIFNEKEVDELILLDITATTDNKRPNLDLLSDMAGECFMPLAYGGGVKSLEDFRALFGLGVEKVAVNSAAFTDPGLISQAAGAFGSQSVIGAIDVKKSLWGKYKVCHHGGRQVAEVGPVEWARRLEELGAGEILLTSVERDGTFQGYDLELVRQVSQAVGVPVIACGGAGKLEHLGQAVKQAGASAVALGSMVVYQGPHRAVLINFPRPQDLKAMVD
ncbi:MAG: imidazole glycerol phosphate synthase subunit HisF [Desulfarculus sp.]|nr:imidazole glycerol phosphate synthase subunit HisF [Desulfarculus sp.]